MKFCARGIALLFFLFAWLSPPRAAAQCDEWRQGPRLEFPGIYGNVYTTIIWDPDGTGPIAPGLVVAGTFTTARDATVNGIARWDGAAWQPFGTGMAADSGYFTVNTLAMLPPSFGAMAGQLVAGGDFDSAGGTPAQGLARWDGSAWRSVPGWGTSFHRVVSGLAVAPAGTAFAGELVAVATGGVNLLVAHLNGTTMTYVLGLTTGHSGEELNCLTYWDPDGTGPQVSQLVVGGFFGQYVSTQLRNIARWDGAAWQPFAGGLTGEANYYAPVRALAVIPPGNGPFAGQLVAGGHFTRAGNAVTILNYAARWDGTAWRSFGSGFDYVVSSFTTWDPDLTGPLTPQLVVGGGFDTINGVPVSPGIARWDGAAWQSIGGGVHYCTTLTTYDPDGGGSQPAQLVAGGNGLYSGSAGLGSLAHYSASAPTWTPFTQFGGGTVYALAQLGGRMIAAGAFTSAAGSQPHHIAQWDGVNDSSVGGGFNGPVHALKTYTTGFGISQINQLVAGGEFTTAGGMSAIRVAIWNENAVVGGPTSWGALGSGFNGTVYAIERFNNVIYAAGQFTTSGATSVSRIAQWNGSSWQPVGTGLNGTCYVLKVFNGSLYAGGSFTTAGGISAPGLARWSGSAWSGVGGQPGGTVYALTVHGTAPFLVVGGDFNGVAASPNVASTDGASWSRLGFGTDGAVHSAISDGSNLYIGGAFTHASGNNATRIARWNGVAWNDVRGGVDNVVYALAAFHGEIHAGGSFQNLNTGALFSPGWARYLTTGAPWIAIQPLAESTECGGYAQISLTPAAGYSELTPTWRHNGMPVPTGPTGTGSSISAGTTIFISNASSADAGAYDCIISNACGSATSISATLTITGSGGSGDGNGDGLEDADDIQGFVTMAITGASQGRGICAYDMNADGIVNTADLPLFLAQLLN